jgi:hypothetical protein
MKAGVLSKIAAFSVMALAITMYANLCFDPRQLDCTCANPPILSQQVMCTAAVWFSTPPLNNCVMHAGEYTIPKKPFGAWVSHDTDYTTYQYTNFTCVYTCTHGSHPFLCPINHAIVVGEYRCNENAADPQGPPCRACE